MKKFVVIGDSNFAGWALNPTRPHEDDKFNAASWQVLCHRNIEHLKNLELVNFSDGGLGNVDIFRLATQCMANNFFADPEDKIKYMFVGWTVYPRYYINAGLELHQTNISFAPRGIQKDVKLVDFVIPKNYVNDLISKFKALHHPHYGIVEVISFANILKKLAQAQNIHIYFVNICCPWDNNYFVKLEEPNTLPSDYTPYTQNKILKVEPRTDTEIFSLYNQIHQDYERAGGINPGDWINLYHSLIDSIVDKAHDQTHGGPQTHYNFFQAVKSFLKTKQTTLFDRGSSIPIEER